MNAGRIDFNRVAMFVQIANAGGVTAAATLLKLPKSSVSRALTQLEAELGVELVVRTSRSFRLTEAGTTFYRAASQGIATVDGAREAIRREKDTPHGLVRVAAPANVVAAVLAPLAARFIRQYPKVQVELSVVGRPVDPIRDGFDLVVTGGKLADSSSKVRSIGSMDAGVFASPGYLREFGRPERPSELAKHDCILRAPSTGRKDRWRLTGPKGPVVVAVDGHIRVDDIMAAVGAAAAGGGLVLLPFKLASTEPSMRALERVLSDYVVRGETAQLVYPAQRYVPLHVALFRDAVLAHARESCLSHDTAHAAQ